LVATPESWPWSSAYPGTSDFNKIIEIKEREAHRVKLSWSRSIRTKRRWSLRDLINQMKTSKDPNYSASASPPTTARWRPASSGFPGQRKDHSTILTTSQKLSTGVDARNIRNIVLMRSINSMIEFKQIIGRGTRLYDGKITSQL